LGLHQAQDLGPEVVGPVRPADPAAGDLAAAKVDAFHFHAADGVEEERAVRGHRLQRRDAVRPRHLARLRRGDAHPEAVHRTDGRLSVAALADGSERLQRALLEREGVVFDDRIVRPYGIPAPAANHYVAEAAIRQKIGALVGRARPQARDVWDLDHLFRRMPGRPTPKSSGLQGVIETALERVMEIPYEAFRAHVMPFLAADQRDLFDTPATWDRLREHVAARLVELSS
jgi:hypothetical protein